jgi:hypothetical protein
MRFFGSSKKDAKKRPQAEAETRTDVTTKTINRLQDQPLRLPLTANTIAQHEQLQEQHPPSSPRKKGVLHMPVVVTATKPSTVQRGERGALLSPNASQLQPGPNVRSPPSAKQTEQATSPRHRSTGCGSGGTAFPGLRPAGSGGGQKAAEGKAQPPSILHKNKQPPPPQPTFSLNIPPPPASNPRVRFLSAGESVASSAEASQVHLMAGAAGSVASSSAMSSVPGENVFDRVLHAVMAEENQRLNAMGMARMDPKGDYAAAGVPSRADSPPPAPIDMDTGLTILPPTAGMDMDYHDLNDDDVDEERWNQLNGGSTLASGMRGLAMDGGGGGAPPLRARSRSRDNNPRHSRGGGGAPSAAAAYADSIGSRKSGASRKLATDAQWPRKSGPSSASRTRSTPTSRGRVDDVAEF